MREIRALKPWSEWTVAMTGINARPENPGPGMAVARCLKEAAGFNGEIIGLGYYALDAGMHNSEFCDRGYLLEFPSVRSDAYSDRLFDVLEQAKVGAVIPCLDSELALFASLANGLNRRGIRVMMPGAKQLKARDKDRLPELCKSVGMATPDCHRVTDPAFFGTCGEKGLEYPLVGNGVCYDAHDAYDPLHPKRCFAALAGSVGISCVGAAHSLGPRIQSGRHR